MSKKWLTMFDVYENPVPVESNPGTATREEYKLSVGKDGRKCLTKIRDIDISAYINSFAPGCDMAVILDKLQAGLISTDYAGSFYSRLAHPVICSICTFSIFILVRILTYRVKKCTKINYMLRQGQMISSVLD